MFELWQTKRRLISRAVQTTPLVKELTQEQSMLTLQIREIAILFGMTQALAGGG
jgi:hypothetical protein